jgi:hypothetical protein
MDVNIRRLSGLKYKLVCDFKLCDKYLELFENRTDYGFLFLYVHIDFSCIFVLFVYIS